MITLHFSREDTLLLRQQLERQIVQLERELVRTDAPRMQHELARDFDRVKALLATVDRALSGADVGEPPDTRPAIRPSV
jgi:hypothetical protein